MMEILSSLLQLAITILLLAFISAGGAYIVKTILDLWEGGRNDRR